MAKNNKERQKLIDNAIAEDKTRATMSDGSRKWKIFKQDDDNYRKNVEMVRWLVRHIDRNLIDATVYEETDDDGHTHSLIAVAIQDDEKGNFIYTIDAMYLSKGTREEAAEELKEGQTDIREKIDSSNEGESK